MRLLTPELSQGCVDSYLIVGLSLGFFFKHNFIKLMHYSDTLTEL